MGTSCIYLMGCFHTSGSWATSWSRSESACVWSMPPQGHGNPFSSCCVNLGHPCGKWLSLGWPRNVALLCVNCAADFKKACTDLKEPNVMYRNLTYLGAHSFIRCLLSTYYMPDIVGSIRLNHFMTQTVVYITQIHSRNDHRKGIQISSVMEV